MYHGDTWWFQGWGDYKGIVRIHGGFKAGGITNVS